MSVVSPKNFEVEEVESYEIIRLMINNWSSYTQWRLLNLVSGGVTTKKIFTRTAPCYFIKMVGGVPDSSFTSHHWLGTPKKPCENIKKLFSQRGFTKMPWFLLFCKWDRHFTIFFFFSWAENLLNSLLPLWPLNCDYDDAFHYPYALNGSL